MKFLGLLKKSDYNEREEVVMNTVEGEIKHLIDVKYKPVSHNDMLRKFKEITDNLADVHKQKSHGKLPPRASDTSRSITLKMN